MAGSTQPQQLVASGTVERCWVYRLSPLRYRTALVFSGGGRSLPAVPEDPVAVRKVAVQGRTA
jgi:hypothetical protein